MTTTNKRAHGRRPRSVENVAVDKHVGSRMRLRRSLLGMSQAELADRLGITFQQVQKYERGANRVSASRLWDLSQVLDVPVGFFFDDMGDQAAPAVPDLKRRHLDLCRRLDRLSDAQQLIVCDLVAALASAQGGEHA